MNQDKLVAIGVNMKILFALILATLFVMATSKRVFSPINVVICILFLIPLLIITAVLLAINPI